MPVAGYFWMVLDRFGLQIDLKRAIYRRSRAARLRSHLYPANVAMHRRSIDFPLRRRKFAAKRAVFSPFSPPSTCFYRCFPPVSAPNHGEIRLRSRSSRAGRQDRGDALGEELRTTCLEHVHRPSRLGRALEALGRPRIGWHLPLFF